MGYGYDIVQQPAFPVADRGLLAVATIITTDDPGLHPIQWEPDWCTSGGGWGTCAPGGMALECVQDPINKLKYSFNITGAPGDTATVDFGDGTAPVTVPVTHDTPAPAAAGDKQLDGGMISTALPFAVYDGIDCSRLGLVNEEAKARLRLSYSEGYQAENAFWTGQHGAYPYLASPAAKILAPADKPVSVPAGVGMLEDWLSDACQAQGVMHANRRVAAWAADHWLFNYQNSQDHLRTALNTSWAFGPGYPNTGPDGTDPGDGLAWIYATGPVVVRRSAVSFASNIVDPTSNRVFALAEREYLITYECAVAAVCVAQDPVI